MKILVTGAAGQVGQALINNLQQSEIDFRAFNRHELDITNNTQVSKVINDIQPTIVVNAAAYTAVDKAESEVQAADGVNHIGAKNLAHAANEVDAAIIHISTDYVFDGTGNDVYRESDTTCPVSVYGKTKLDGENAVLGASDKAIVLRTSWVFGEYGNNFVKTMLKLAATKNELSVVADQFGAPTYADDIAKAIITLCKKISVNDDFEYGIFNFSGYPYVSWYDFANCIFDEAHKQNIITNKPVVTKTTTQNYPTPAKRPLNSRLCIDKIKNVHGIESSNWQQALKNLQAFGE